MVKQIFISLNHLNIPFIKINAFINWFEISNLSPGNLNYNPNITLMLIYPEKFLIYFFIGFISLLNKSTMVNVYK